MDEGRETNLISESHKLMQPLQKMMADGHCSMISQLIGKAVEIDIFSAAYALSVLSAELIVNMEEQGMAKEAEAIKKDWINTITNPSEFVRLDDEIVKKEIKGRWKL